MDDTSQEPEDEEKHFLKFQVNELLTQVEKLRTSLKEAEKRNRLKSFVTSNDLQNNDELCNFFTGFSNYEHFKFVLDTLGPSAYELTYWNNINPRMSVEDQFLLVLLKIRRNYTNYELTRFFDRNDKVVTSVFVTWINFMFLQWSEINWWPCRELVSFFAAEDFLAKHPHARVTLDATEVPIVKPQRSLLQSGSYSNYKNKNTLKIMVGTSPGGLVTHLSDVYGGWVSDRQMVERSDVLGKCDPGDEILADKGINIEDLVVPHNIGLNMPTFFKKRNRIASKTVISDRACSSKRCHVERHIGNAKNFHIISTNNALKPTESILGREILSVCFILTNLKNNIMPHDG